jgi:predicted ATPase/DNA-binding SARP family transcriptional activator
LSDAVHLHNQTTSARYTNLPTIQQTIQQSVAVNASISEHRVQKCGQEGRKSVYKTGIGVRGGQIMKTGNEEATEVRLQIQLFGAFDVRVNGVPIPPLRSRKVQWLLALLILRHGQALDRAWLAGTLWPESAHSQALYNLRQSLSNLRHVLGETGLCLHAPMVNALSLDLTRARVDVLAFDAAIAAGDETSLEHAVALYRGPLLEGCAEEWVFSERRTCEESYLCALERLADMALSRGEGSAAVTYLRAAIQTDPFRERAQRALIQALASVGDYGAAVQTYRDLRLLLRRELNTDPDPETVTLFQHIRSEARRLTLVRPSVSIEPAPAPSRQLPSPLTALVGRRPEVEQIVTTLRTVRLLTLTGSGGVGKTRLAIAVAEEVAEEYPDGVFFVDLAPLSDPALIAQSVATVLQVREEPGRSTLLTLREHLQSKTLLLLLDNCEHLLDPCASVVDAILHNCSGVDILATSRQILGLTGEVRWTVPPLTTPALTSLTYKSRHSPKEWLSLLSEYEAVALFVIRAQQAQPTFQMSARNAEAIAQICFHLEGIPLALELAAARVRTLSVEDIKSRLDNRFRLLTGGSRTALPRQQTLRALIDWSYDLLNAQERTLLCRLSVFAGGCTLQAAEHICSGEAAQQGSGESIEDWEVLDVLASLVDKSLVQVEEQEGCVRYRMLETMRQYAAEKLPQNGEAQTLKSRHRDFFLALAEEAEPRLMGPDQALWFDRLETEHDNLRTALHWERGEAAQRLAGALWRFWMVRGYLSEGRERLTIALSHPQSQGSTAIRAKTLSGAGTLARQQGDYASAQRLYEESLAIRRELADRPGIAASLGSLGTMAYTRGDYAAARALYEESLAIQHELGDKHSITGSLTGLGAVAYSQGDYVGARKYHEESLAMRRELGDRLEVAKALGSLGVLVGSQGDYLAARGVFEESLAIRHELGDEQGIAWSLDNLGMVACALCEYASARALHEDGLKIQRELGDRHGIAGSLAGLGAIAYNQGDYAMAQSRHRESLVLKQELGDWQGIAYSLAAFAALASVQEQTNRAARLWGAAEALRERLHVPLPPCEQAQYDRLVAQSRTVMSKDAFATAWSEGSTLTMEQAIEYALKANAI